MADLISAAERDALAAVIREEEARSAGEIVVVVAHQASSYRTVPVVYGLLTALAAPWPLIAFTGLSAGRIFLAQLAVAIVACVLLSMPKRRYRLVPRFLKRARAHEAAAREFLARGVSRTRRRTGVLVYVAVAERYAEIVPDLGLADRADRHVWREAIEGLVEAIRAGRAADGLAVTVRRLGDLLAEYAPPDGEDVDELPNHVIVV